RLTEVQATVYVPWALVSTGTRISWLPLTCPSHWRPVGSVTDADESRVRGSLNSRTTTPGPVPRVWPACGLEEMRSACAETPPGVSTPSSHARTSPATTRLPRRVMCQAEHASRFTIPP